MQTLRLENGKQKKLDQTIEPRLKSKPSPNITEFRHISDSNNDSKLGWY